MGLGFLPIPYPHTLRARPVFTSAFLHEPLLPVNTEIMAFPAMIWLWWLFFPLLFPTFIALFVPPYMASFAVTCFKTGMFADFPISIFILVKMTMYAVCFPAFLMISIPN